MASLNGLELMSQKKRSVPRFFLVRHRRLGQRFCGVTRALATSESPAAQLLARKLSRVKRFNLLAREKAVAA